MDKPPCSIDGCNAIAIRMGMCNKHYRRALKTAPDRPRCSIDGCDKRAHGQGLCATHHGRLLRYGDPLRGRLPSRDPLFGTPHKTCGSCRQVKERSEFYTRSGKFQTPDGLSNACKECSRQRQRDMWATDRPQMERNRLAAKMRDYNSTIEVYEAMLRECSGRCVACDSVPVGARLHIDHDHATDQFRGLLCEKCNVRLARVNDSLDQLVGLLAKHRDEVHRLEGLVAFLQAPPALQFNPDGSRI